jgi:hypothetical protein
VVLGGGVAYRQPSGLFIPLPPRRTTWVYIIVVDTSLCSSNSLIVRMAASRAQQTNVEHRTLNWTGYRLLCSAV